ncbi:competence type IV pilus major pilin ComGC [Bacillus suaedaesalsae]|uniref:Prepilin-type N-terminal cleavage/methylation domain-containing protein n=1 Tax=Bacillus suaedaesalsae TaxID=2810349 RepID=A0ABS2DNP6_9BACI|nr:prepilin-type N-terminal cleavage/methylation domain-containing protein [Bacillus suaedaesalsae]MBM6619755.1 prepilin-type N-terminal cleavage/methylation domain-containing protein [Bacillus suaedaesalsae]
MVKNFMKKMKEQKGLTLVELLAVIVILGIIAGIAVPSISNIIEKSKEDAYQANIDMIEAAGKLAAIAEEDEGTDEGYSVEELVAAKYLDAAPLSPFDGDVEFDGTYNAGKYTEGTEKTTKPDYVTPTVPAS